MYLLKNKSNAFNSFKEWKILVEAQTEKKVKKLITDNGLDLCSDEFNHFCKSNAIARHLTSPRTPQQNVLVKMKYKTLLDKVRCLLIEPGLPKSFWAEVLKLAMYLVKTAPSSAIWIMLPMEKWSRIKIDYDDLRVYGCLAYLHVSQGKLEPSAIYKKFHD